MYKNIEIPTSAVIQPQNTYFIHTPLYITSHSMLIQVGNTLIKHEETIQTQSRYTRQKDSYNLVIYNLNHPLYPFILSSTVCIDVWHFVEHVT